MYGGAVRDGVVLAHAGALPPPIEPRCLTRQERETSALKALAIGATQATGAGRRLRPEEPDPWRTCFERDRDRILHSNAFRRLSGKTQVFVFPDDHQRTRLTHALEVAQVACAVARAVGANVALTEAIALGHDCGHGPGGHASEDAFDLFLPGGYNHAVWGADVVLAPLNLCAETLDGIRHHSWSLPTPTTPEGVIVSWSDRAAYSAHDLEDAVSAGIVHPDELPALVKETLGVTRSSQLRALINALIGCIGDTGVIGMDERHAAALAELRSFNYRYIYTRPDAVAQSDAVIKVISALVEHFAEHPEGLAERENLPENPLRAAVTYVAGMTDRFAFDTATRLLNWPASELPRGIDSP